MKIYELILYWRESKMSRETDVVGYVQSRLLRFRSMDPRQCRFAPVASLKTFFELSYKHRCRYAPDAFAHACRSARCWDIRSQFILTQNFEHSHWSYLRRFCASVHLNYPGAHASLRRSPQWCSPDAIHVFLLFLDSLASLLLEAVPSSVSWLSAMALI